MKCRSRIKRPAVYLIMAALLSAFLPGTAAAAVKKVKAEKLIQSRTPQANIRSPFFVSCKSGSCFYYYPLKLPAGAVLEGLSYRHSGQGTGAQTIVGLDRVKPVAATPLQRIYQGDSTEDTGSLYDTVKVVGELQDGAVKKVRNSWDYLLVVETSASPLGAVGTIKVIYKPPAP